ncbi:hypothetical protein LEN26_013806 [Aphanomyces euteiches]|nr:hypothetical protein LEN26_013806 [Aphanomyces euteiches]KAH9116528.1 hypothetical protein AeMF1_009564 [Aphanomyces euteiches]KAH9190379.1 hypothetical protein AeNC1_007641 [Aphanomyces euteiches]
MQVRSFHHKASSEMKTVDDQPGKKRSRFSDVETTSTKPEDAPREDVAKKPKLDPAAIARAAAAAISKQLPKHIGTAASAEDREKARLAAEKDARIQQIVQSTREQIKQVQNMWTGFDKKSYMPAPLLLDDQGRHIDAMGNVLTDTVAPVATLKANIGVSDAQKEPQKPVNPYLAHRTIDKEDRLDSVDPRVKVKKRETRGAKNFAFVKQGTFIKQGDQMRAREAKKMLAGFSSGRNPNAYVKETIADVEDDGDGEGEKPAAATHDQTHVDVPMKAETPVPEVEWWDIVYLPKDKQELVDKNGYLKAIGRSNTLDYNTDMRLKHAGTSHLIEHPARIKVARKEQVVTLPIMLTKAERKRIRRTTRAERLKETQDKIALGLLPPPEPKVKLANMMRVLQDQAVADPSAVERKVRAQVAQREKNHEMRNLARKLTPEERREKTLQKLKKDASGDICVALFKVPILTHPQHKFKVDVNAQQLHLTGAVLTVTENVHLNLVVVEGGPKSIKAYIKLMCRRIDWSLKETKPKEGEDAADGDDGDKNSVEQESDQEDEEMNGKKPKCYLVWQGVVAKRTFSNFRFQECRNAQLARKVLESKHVEQYWDMVESYNPALDGVDEDDE